MEIIHLDKNVKEKVQMNMFDISTDRKKRNKKLIETQEEIFKNHSRRQL